MFRNKAEVKSGTREGRREMYRGALVGKPEGKRPLGGPRRRWEEHIKLVLKKWMSWTGLIWLGNRGRLLWTWWWTFGFHWKLGISRVAEELLASEESPLHSVSQFPIFPFQTFNTQSVCIMCIQRLPTQHSSTGATDWIHADRENTKIRFFLKCCWPCDRICGLVVRVSGYRYIGLGFDSRRYQIFWVVAGLERGPLSLVRSIEELLE